jgi:hypothetical protein
MSLSDADRRAIYTAPPLMLAEWWAALNRWDWPVEGLGEPEPPARSPGGRRSEIMREIIDRIGLKECLREWNRKHLPGNEFDAWWDSRERMELLQ